MVWRLYVWLEGGINQHFDFKDEAKAKEQQKIYQNSGCSATLSYIMINSDHQVPWAATPWATK